MNIPTLVPLLSVVYLVPVPLHVPLFPYPDLSYTVVVVSRLSNTQYPTSPTSLWSGVFYVLLGDPNVKVPVKESSSLIEFLLGFLSIDVTS